MNETDIIPAHDNKKIYVVFTPASSPSGRLVILSHGLTGSTTEFLHVMVARYLTSVGYDVARIAYYGHQPDARKFYDTTIASMSRDLTTVVTHYRNNYDNICIAGHSYGGTAVLIANPNVSVISFWDATIAPTWWQQAIFHSESNDYELGLGQGQRVSANVYQEAKFFYHNPPIVAAQALKSPAQVIITGGDNAHTQSRLALFENLAPDLQKSIHKFDLANHDFTNGHSIEQLLDLTQYWFDRFTLNQSHSTKRTLGN